ncbi:unnamed protein product [Mytilus coruscus]|uniref:Uncharacterized protein n=1 Tax=Mytilus coruscus TaxID=42192 RepID=A0A6J8E5E3_MYTCO|nr:unnamed protein product [Mytilus coruscus]
MLRSPASTQISIQMKTFPTCTIATPLCRIPSFESILTKATHVTSGKLHLVTVPLPISLTKCQAQQSVPVAAMPVPSQRQLPSIAPAPEISQQYTVQSSDRHDMSVTESAQRSVLKSSKRSLKFSELEKENLPTTKSNEEVEIKTILAIKEEWEKGGYQKYQLIGDNWDKNILPSYRTSDRKTVSLHLFNIYAIVDRVQPVPLVMEENPQSDLPVLDFLPSIEEQFPFGLFDCNENKTPEIIKLMKKLSKQYVPCVNGEIVEPVFFGGQYSLLLKMRPKQETDLLMKNAQNAMANGHTAMERLEGFISKIEDFQRLMNFLEAIHKMTCNTESVAAKCTVYYYRNILNMRNVKGKVCNSYRAYQLLYYAILDAIILNRFLRHLHLEEVDQEINIPQFSDMSNEEKLSCLNEISESILEERVNLGVLPPDQSERLIANRFVNLQGGTNNNISLDEYLEMLNRDTKVTCSGHQTKKSILKHSKEYPHLVNFASHFDNITNLTGKKGFHHLPSYQADVQTIAKDLLQENVLTYKTSRIIKCKERKKKTKTHLTVHL